MTLSVSGFAGEQPVEPLPLVSASVSVEAPEPAATTFFAAAPVPSESSEPIPALVAPPPVPQPEAQSDPPRLPPEPVPVIAAPPEEKEEDRIMTKGEVDLRLSENREEEREADGTAEFFVSAQLESQHKDSDLYSGLMGRIDKFIRYFQTSGRDRFELYLTRSGKYSDMMRGILATYGLPGDLIYLALIESGFSPKAYSVARAAGPWQFIAGTGRRYGLRIDWWTDERRDYEKSTHAAASYLKDLYGMFESWPLATAAYNAGEGKIKKAVMRYRSEDYVKLIRHRYLKQETKDYVPKMIAALTIAKDPEKFGFGGVKYEDPLEFDKVTVPGGTDLPTLGRIIGVPYESLREWNPELRRFCTPPNQEDYEIRLPKGYGSIAEEHMEEIKEDANVTFLLHTVKKGESLESLASRYHTTVPILQELNGMKRPRVKRSARLVIPMTGLSEEEAVPGKEVSTRQVETALKRLDDVSRRRTRTVRVRRGDTLSRLAKRTGVTVDELAEENGLTKKSRLKIGRRLRVPGTWTYKAGKSVAGDGGGKKEIRHVVRRGDTLSKIAKVYGVSPELLSERNNLKDGQTLPRGRVLRIPLES
jgi:membrane-bound lytic murein transglycosylase D